jgi:hypothetical protein
MESTLLKLLFQVRTVSTLLCGSSILWEREFKGFKKLLKNEEYRSKKLPQKFLKHIARMGYIKEYY